MRRRTSKPTNPELQQDEDADRPRRVTGPLPRLGRISPPPFFGRQAELSQLRDQLSVAPVTVVHGAVGSGKTRLVRQLAASLDVPVAFVRAFPGDRGAALKSRAERAMRCLPGGLAQALQSEVRVLVIDDAHHLSEDEAAAELPGLVPGPTALGRLVLITRDALPLGRTLAPGEVAIGGLDDVAARELWAHLEEAYGPTPHGAIDAAIAKTRGMPLAMRREYARAAFACDAWKLDELTPPLRKALAALAVLRIPAAPAAVAAMSPSAESGLIELAARQLIDPLEDGRFAVHDVVHDEVIPQIAIDERVELERRAAQLVAGTGRGKGSKRPAWEAGDDGALGALDPIDRLREVVLHHLAAGDVALAIQHLATEREVAARRGAAGEIEALIIAIGPGADPSLRSIQVELAARAGRVAEASELSAGRGVASPVLAAELALAGGDVGGAVQILAHAVDHAAADERARAVALLADIELLRGNASRAAELITGALERDRDDLDAASRARLYLAQARVEDFAGRVASARAALARAQGAFRASGAGGVAAVELGALIDARRALCLAREGRLSEATAALDAAEAAAREVDALAVADEVRASRAQVAARRGDTDTAVAILRELVASRRARGDETGALIVEVDLAEVFLRRGEVVLAAELAAAAQGASSRRRLGHVSARAEVVLAAIDVAEVRLDTAIAALERLGMSQSLDAASRAFAAVTAADARASIGHRTGAIEIARSAGTDEVRDDIDRELAVAMVAMSAGDVGTALDAARTVAARAERAGRIGDLASALVVLARLELARGERVPAMAAASRAAREAATSGLVRPRCQALLALAALARDDGDVSAAAAYARDAADLAHAAGLPVERLAANGALDAIAGGEARADSSHGSAATMTPAAIEAAGRLLGDLGLTAMRPFRVVSAEGGISDVADADPEVLRLPARSLAVDGVREVIWRSGVELADLRRRSLLKRLLFLFASQPGRTFSKEDIVQSVWNVEYHPLRHDAALFTNIMRIRRLLGEDGAEIIRVTEDGYRFQPPKDFVFVHPVN
ncbi:MAG TPA: winged helix-turn-helix domain-containing protein [Kofleriaceae bacterium]|nr:winged helix-turn-helix domain-containing protein [Kofleriaceae bacterium]